MKKNISLIFCALFLVSGCGGNGSPTATLSTNTLTFSSVFEGTTSPAQSIMLSNTGMAPLSITGIAASGSFAETNTCGSTLPSGATCTISVTFTPGNAGDLTGKVSVSDNAAGSPQTVALSGAGSSGTLSGTCVQSFPVGPTRCRGTTDPAECPAGQVAKKPELSSCTEVGISTYVDGASSCLQSGLCEVTP